MRTLLDLPQISRFLAVAEAGSFRSAATRLGISQPTLSWSIQQLEEVLGTRLIERGARGATLTTDGELLLPRAKLLVSEAGRAAADFAALKGKRETSLNIGIAPMFINAPVPRATAATLARVPGLSIRVIERTSGDLIKALQEGEIDLAFGGKPAQTDAAGVTFEPIHRQRYALVARGQHPIFKQRRIVDKSVLSYDWVMFDAVRYISFERDTFRRKGLPLPRVTVRSNSMPYIKAMTLNSDLLGYLALDYVGAEIRDGMLREVQNSLMGYTAAAGLLTRDGGAQTPAMKILKAELRAACAV